MFPDSNLGRKLFNILISNDHIGDPSRPQNNPI